MSEKVSEVEIIKRNSRRLRGGIAEGLVDPVTGDIAEADTQLLKFHGIYRQDDRDVRDERRRQKLEPDFQFMIRLRLPGGGIQAWQWRKLNAIAKKYGTGSLRITTRQSLQLHGIRKCDLREAVAAINEEAGLDTRGACGDVNRNVICSVNPHKSAAHAAVFEQARVVSQQLNWQSGAYDEIWLKGKPDKQAQSEPLYGETYLPRKFKVAFAIPPENDVDVLANDLGFTALIDKGKLVGYNVAVGGGMGMSYGEQKTRPRLASPIGAIETSQVLAVAKAVVTIQRDYGNRADRKQARLKYTLEDRGLDWFKTELNKRLGFSLQPLKSCRFESNGDRFGWIEGENGLWHLTLSLPSGRVADVGKACWQNGLDAIAAVHDGQLRLTTNQNIVIANVSAEGRETIDRLVIEYGLHAYLAESALRRHSMACVAFPTCGLAMAEAERYLPELQSKLEVLLDKYGLLQTPITLRLSGCPNGCARPYLGEIALTGKAPGRYNLLLGASFAGERMNALYRENIDEAEILDTLDGLFKRFAAEREPEEHFGDFLRRVGIVPAVAGFHTAVAA